MIVGRLCRLIPHTTPLGSR